MARSNRLAVKLKIGNLSFWVTSSSGGGTRRLAIHTALGRDGATLEDLGEDPRSDTFELVAAEWEYAQLEQMRRSGKAQTIVHPLYGTYQGRIQSCNYKAGPSDMVEVSLTIIEDGEYRTQATVFDVGLDDAAASASGALGDFGDQLDLLDGSDDIDATLSAAATQVNSSLGSFEEFLDDLVSGDIGLGEISAAYDQLSGDVGELLDALDSAVTDMTALADIDLDGLAYAALGACATVVEAAAGQAGAVWRETRVLAPTSLHSLAREYLGSDDEDAITRLLAANPTIIDTAVIPIGLELLVPL